MEATYAGWTRARADLLRASVDRVFALLAASRVDDEGWRAAVAAEASLWRAIRDAGAPDVPPRFAEVHRRHVDMLNVLVDAGDQLRAAIDGRDPELLARAMARLDGAQRAARDVFAAAFRLTDTPETGG